MRGGVILKSSRRRALRGFRAGLKCSAFTLAEILITLGIIGVVAALTMPALISKANGEAYKAAYKKALSSLSQAVIVNIAQSGYDLSETIPGTNPTVGSHGDSLNDEKKTLYSIFNERLDVIKVATGDDFNSRPGDARYYPVITNKDKSDYTAFAAAFSNSNSFVDITAGNAANNASGESSWSENSTMLFFKDGTTLIFDNSQSGCRKSTAILPVNYCYAFIDVNGQKGPNKVVECDNGTGGGGGKLDLLSDMFGGGPAMAMKVQHNTSEIGALSDCTVSNPTDIYPIAMFNHTIVPASSAASAVFGVLPSKQPRAIDQANEWNQTPIKVLQ